MMKPMEEMGLGRGYDLGKICSTGTRCVFKDGGEEAGVKTFPREKTGLKK
jgi:hypothetical protein